MASLAPLGLCFEVAVERDTHLAPSGPLILFRELEEPVAVARVEQEGEPLRRRAGM
jgi:hypothetical protein